MVNHFMYMQHGGRSVLAYSIVSYTSTLRSKRRRSRLWSEPVNLRTWGLVSDPIAMVQAFAELRYGVVAHTLENSMKYGHNLGHTPYSLLPGPSGYRNPVVRGAWYSILLPRTLCVHHEEHYYPSFSSLKLKSSP